MLTALLVTLALVALLAFSIYKYFNVTPTLWLDQNVPVVRQGEIASLFSRMTFRTSFRDFDRAVYKQLAGQKYGGYMDVRAPVFYVKDLDLMRLIFVKDFDHFVDRRLLGLDKSDPVLAKMMHNLSGKAWKDLRSVMTPTFTTSRLKKMFQLFNACGRHLVDYLKEKDGYVDENVVDFQDCFGRYTMDVIASTNFGIDTSVFSDKDSKFIQMVQRFQKAFPRRMLSVLIHLLCPPLANFLTRRLTDTESKEFFASVVQKNIEYRRSEENSKGQGVEKRQDFLQMMLEVQSGHLKSEEQDLVDNYEKDAVLKSPCSRKRNLSSDILDDESIISQSFLFFVAGANTMESLLTFTAYELALNPEVQERLAEEVAEVMESDGELTYEVTHSMVYMDQVISEVLRVHPPALATDRVCTKEYTVPGTTVKIPKGTRIILPINSVHHDENIYPNPDKFDPENFNAEAKAKRHPYAYLPFGHGPRNCIAMRFALTEAKTAIAHLVHNFRLEPSAYLDIPIKIGKKTEMLKPENGLPLKFTARR